MKTIFSKLCAKKRAVAVPPDFVNIDNLLDITLPGHGTCRNARVKSEKIVTKFGESLNLVMFLVNISVKNDKQLKLLKKVIILFQFV